MKFEDIKVGDEVVLELSTRIRSEYYYRKVDRLTNTLVILGDGSKFRKKDGKQYPDAGEWAFNDYIHLCSEEMDEKVNKTHLLRKSVKLRDFNFTTLLDSNPDLLDKVYDLVFGVNDDK